MADTAQKPHEVSAREMLERKELVNYTEKVKAGATLTGPQRERMNQLLALYHPDPNPPKAPQTPIQPEDPEAVEWEERAIAAEDRVKYGHSAAKSFRLEQVARMLVQGKENAQICVELGQKWGKAPRTMRGYIMEAWHLLEKRAEQNANMLRGQQIGRINRLWRLAEEQKSPRAMADAIEILSRMCGLNATEQRALALSGPNGEALTMAIVELPDNGRGGNQQATRAMPAQALAIGEGQAEGSATP